VHDDPAGHHALEPPLIIVLSARLDQTERLPPPRRLPVGDYLNSPPAEQLRLRYPGAHRDRVRHQARIDYLGIDPLPQTRSWTRRS
jgi:hypothetical protein